MRYKVFFAILGFSIITFIAITPLRSRYGGGFPISSLIGFIAFFFLTMFCLERYKSKLSVWIILFAILLGHWVLELPLRVLDFNGSLISLPDSIVHSLGILFGYLYWRLKNPFDVLTAIIGFSIPVFMLFQGYDYWLHYLNFGTFTGSVSYSLPAKFKSFDESRNAITEENFKGKIVLLDFWYSRCGVCFVKFPQVQAFYEKYKNDSSVIILAVDKPIEEDKEKSAFQIIREEGYSFPVVVATDENMPEKFGVKGYPTTFVIDQNGTVVFKGDIEKAVNLINIMKSK